MSLYLVFQSHPIQYFSPLYKAMTDGGLDVEVNYYTSHGLNNELDREFGAKVKWDIPLLEGYKSTFLKNNAISPSIYGFFGCINWPILRKVKESQDAKILVYGWKYFSDVLVMFAAILMGKKLCIRTETPWSQESLNTSFKARIKRSVLKNIIFPRVEHFFYIGQENKKFYKHLGVSEDKLVFVPYSVDNNRFRISYSEGVNRKKEIRKRLDIPENKLVFLYSGKLIPKKRPMDLLEALQRIKNEEAFVVFLGDGELRVEMEAFIEDHKMNNVSITGFVNQGEVGSFYIASDVFVMCSEVGETWGLSTNEAMNFHLPLILSKLTGSSADLVQENGCIFETGDVDDLEKRMQYLLSLSQPERLRMGDRSSEIVKTYSYDTIVNNLLSLNQS